jgi:hypothetical protein
MWRNYLSAIWRKRELSELSNGESWQHSTSKTSSSAKENGSSSISVAKVDDWNSRSADLGEAGDQRLDTAGRD